MYYPLTAGSLGKLASQSASKKKYDGRQRLEIGRTDRDGRADQSHVGSEMNTRLFCVRLSDGYFFPAPNSQFVGENHVENTLDRCRYICDTKEIEVYELRDMSLETEDMVSVEGNKSYRELPSAFRYREDQNFEGCDFRRYHRRANEARARSITPYNMMDAIIPVPTPRPEPRALAGDLPDDEASADPIRTAGIYTVRPKVRVVMPAYFPLE